ncbi:MAG: YbaB/EbfC family nucleoid-associated protein [Armatimonadetes bacterium]|nr:YbaB/EbfC family nucleoid-associated protein [Armatimonadota bacterium]
MNNPLGNLGNLGGLMKQVKKMQEDMQRVQAELDSARITASSGGGMVSATVTGKSELVEVKIDPQVVDPDDVEMLEDLVTSAIREAQETASKQQADRMQEITGGMGIPPGLI